MIFLQYFDNFQASSLNPSELKKWLKDKIRILTPGDEIIINWITTDIKGFCPIKIQVPGPQTHRRLVNFWLHRCGLLHEASYSDPRPTRIFSDSDCRTHSLHLRRDSKEDTLDLCKQLGWKVPPAFSDTGSAVYRRSDAVVTSKEYNTRLISWLQLQYEGRLAAKAGINWPTIVESARLNYIQVLKAQSDKKTIPDMSLREDLQMQIVEKLSMENLSQVERSIDIIEATLNDMTGVSGINLRKMAKDIADIVVESLTSSEEAGQREYWKMKKRKLNNGSKTRNL